MNQRMGQAIGSENADRMHERLGRRVAGCAGGAAAGVPMGPRMKGGSANGEGWGMMCGSGWGRMHNGSWQHLSQSQWRNLAATMMGARYLNAGPTVEHRSGLAVVLAAVLLGAFVAVLLSGDLGIAGRAERGQNRDATQPRVRRATRVGGARRHMPASDRSRRPHHRDRRRARLRIRHGRRGR